MRLFRDATVWCHCRTLCNSAEELKIGVFSDVQVPRQCPVLGVWIAKFTAGTVIDAAERFHRKSPVTPALYFLVKRDPTGANIPLYSGVAQVFLCEDGSIRSVSLRLFHKAFSRVAVAWLWA